MDNLFPATSRTWSFASAPIPWVKCKARVWWCNLRMAQWKGNVWVQMLSVSFKYDLKQLKDILKHPPLADWSAGFEPRVAWLVLCTGTAAEVTGTNDWRSDLSQTTLWDDPTQQGPPPACCPAHWGVEAVSNWENRRARIWVFNRKTHPYTRIWGRRLPFNLWWKSFNLVMVQIEHSEVL